MENWLIAFLAAGKYNATIGSNGAVSPTDSQRLLCVFGTRLLRRVRHP